MKSWDVFDTLVARRERDQRKFLAGVFYGDMKAVDARIAADNGRRNLLEIYQQSGLTISTPEELMLREINFERSNLYPITENMDRVQDGDILISDMYIPAGHILDLVRSCGLTKQVTVYQSNQGKASGEIWKALRAAGVELEYHTGDNYRSDYVQPQSQGYQARLYDVHTTSKDIELYFVSYKQTALINIIREVLRREPSNPYREAYAVAGQLNLPWLFIVCEMILRRIHDHSVTFLGRDCQLLYRIWNAYFARVHCNPGYYLPFSRKVALENPVTANQYLNTQSPKDTVFIDISSTGRTWEVLNAAPAGQHNVLVVIHSDQFSYSTSKPVLPSGFSSLHTNTEVGPSNILLEIFNCGDHGRLNIIHSLVDGKLVTAQYAEPELHPELVKIIHTPVQLAVTLTDHYASNLFNQISALDDASLRQIFIDLKNTICAQNNVLMMMKDYVVKDDAYTRECREIR